jgi:hypothetical protein
VADTSGDFDHDIVNNYFITGPSTTSAGDCFFQMDSNQSVYASGNLLDSNNDGVLNGSSEGVSGVTALSAPWSQATYAIPTLSTASAYASDIVYSGAQPRDSVDALVISQVQSLGTQGAIITSQDSDGLGNDGYGTITSGTAFTDTSGDGIADYWASANGLSTTNSAVGGEEYGSTGYTNLEVYINSLILPVGWLGGDIGSPTNQGASSFNPYDNTWLIYGSGDGIWNTSDQFQFASETYSGNGSLSGEVTSQTNTNASAKAGVMFRDSTAANGAYAYALVTPSNGVYFQWRASDGASAQSSSSVSGVTAPVYLKITRSGSSFSAYYSTNGTSWTQVGSTETITMPTAALVGFGVSSTNTGALSLGSFTNVSWPSGIANGVYAITNLKSALVLDAVSSGTSAGTLIDQNTATGNQNQQWAVISIGNGEYNIVGVQSGLYLTSPSSTEGAQLELEPASGSSSQEWVITNAGTPGYYTFQCVSNSYLMDDYGNGTSPGTKVDQWAANGGTNQEWILTAPAE